MKKIGIYAGTLLSFLALLSIVGAMTYSTVTSQNTTASTTTANTIQVNVGIQTNSSSGNSTSIFVKIGSAISGGFSSIGNFFSGIWIGIKAFFHF